MDISEVIDRGGGGDGSKTEVLPARTDIARDSFDEHSIFYQSAKVEFSGGFCKIKYFKIHFVARKRSETRFESSSGYPRTYHNNVRSDLERKSRVEK